ncbi:MAG TPA: discoidin domain-containing protein [Polyangia bacterium]|jgi:hypothetical protein|nr:discoidin domain-containing protein [Polyangia bacterium]
MQTVSIQSMIHGLAARTRAWFVPRRHGRRFSEDQATAIRFFIDRAEARARLAGDDDSAEGASISVGLLRDAAASVLKASDLARRESADATTPTDPVKAFEQLGLAETMPAREAELVGSALREPDPLAFDRWPTEDLALVRPALQDLIRRLRSRIDLRSDAHLRGLGILRVGVVALLVIYALFSAGRRLFSLENVALGRPVQASSRHPGTPEPSGLTDGIKSGKYGVHTQVGHPGTPWVVVDLGQLRDVRRIVVYNRGDTNLDDGLPLVVSLSTDGKSYTTIATRENHFGSGDLLSPPWTIDCAKDGKKYARYVKIEAHHYLVLRELEVFGK